MGEGNTIWTSKSGRLKIHTGDIKLAAMGITVLLSTLGVQWFTKTDTNADVKSLTSDVATRAQTLAANQSNDVDMLQWQLEAVRHQVRVIQTNLLPDVNHPHKFADWSDPIQAQGDFVIPQFYQHRDCLVCGHSEVRSVK